MAAWRHWGRTPPQRGPWCPGGHPGVREGTLASGTDPDVQADPGGQGSRSFHASPSFPAEGRGGDPGVWEGTQAFGRTQASRQHGPDLAALCLRQGCRGPQAFGPPTPPLPARLTPVPSLRDRGDPGIQEGTQVSRWTQASGSPPRAQAGAGGPRCLGPLQPAGRGGGCGVEGARTPGSPPAPVGGSAGSACERSCHVQPRPLVQIMTPRATPRGGCVAGPPGCPLFPCPPPPCQCCCVPFHGFCRAKEGRKEVGAGK